MAVGPARREETCLQVLRPLASSSSLLAHALPAPGSADSADSMNSEAVGVTNRISSTAILKPLTVWHSKLENS